MYRVEGPLGSRPMVRLFNNVGELWFSFSIVNSNYCVDHCEDPRIVGEFLCYGVRWWKLYRYNKGRFWFLTVGLKGASDIWEDHINDVCWNLKGSSSSWLLLEWLRYLFYIFNLLVVKSNWHPWIFVYMPWLFLTVVQATQDND